MGRMLFWSSWPRAIKRSRNMQSAIQPKPTLCRETAVIGSARVFFTSLLNLQRRRCARTRAQLSSRKAQGWLRPASTESLLRRTATRLKAPGRPAAQPRHAARRRWTPPSASSRPRRRPSAARPHRKKSRASKDKRRNLEKTSPSCARAAHKAGSSRHKLATNHQAEIPDAPTRRARGPRRGRDAKASNVADGKLAWQAGNWKPHPDGNKGGPCGDLILAARHALDEGPSGRLAAATEGRRPRGHRAARALFVVGRRWAARSVRK